MWCRELEERGVDVGSDVFLSSIFSLHLTSVRELVDTEGWTVYGAICTKAHVWPEHKEWHTLTLPLPDQNPSVFWALCHPTHGCLYTYSLGSWVCLLSELIFSSHLTIPVHGFYFMCLVNIVLAKLCSLKKNHDSLFILSLWTSSLPSFFCLTSPLCRNFEDLFCLFSTTNVLDDVCFGLGLCSECGLETRPLALFYVSQPPWCFLVCTFFSSYRPYSIITKACFYTYCENII